MTKCMEHCSFHPTVPSLVADGGGWLSVWWVMGAAQHAWLAAVSVAGDNVALVSVTDGTGVRRMASSNLAVAHCPE